MDTCLVVVIIIILLLFVFIYFLRNWTSYCIWLVLAIWKKSRTLLYTVNPLYSDIRYNDKTRYNDILNGTNPLLKMKRIIGDIQEYCI